MTVDFTKPIQLMPDGSYIVTTQHPAYPYNVLPDDPMWQSIQDWLAAGNTATPYVPPAPVAPTPQQQAAATIATITAKLINAQVVGPNAISLGLTAADIANWKAAQATFSGGS
jgi:hypothetical protein